jgi:uncharacterized protein (DUF1778 family)
MPTTTLERAPRTKAAKPAKPAARPGKAPAKEKMLTIRVDVATNWLIDRAANAVGQNRSDFILGTARERATEILLNQRLFTLNDADWARFVDGLDNPPPPNAKLKALLARVPIWDRQ